MSHGKLIVDTDTKFCSGHTTSTTASNGSLDSVTVSATAINGGLKIDGTNVKLIPHRGGSGTAPVPIATALVPTAATWAAGIVTLTVTNTYANGDWIGVGGIFGADILDGYNGVFEVITATASSLTYAVATDPGTATVTNAKCLKYYRCDQTQTATLTTGTSWATNVTTYVTTAAHTFVVGNTVVITGATPAGYNGTYVVTSVPSTTSFTVANITNPGAWTSGGTVTKTVKSIYLGCWSSFTAGPTTATISATGYLKVKNVTNGPFAENLSLTIQGGTTPVATAMGPEIPGWIEVVGAELGTTPAAFTIPRMASLIMTGAWFAPITMPFTIATGTAWAGSISTYTTSAAHGLTPGAIVTITGTTPTGYNGTYQILTVPSTTTFTVYNSSNPGTWTSGGWGYGRLTTNATAQQTMQLPASGGATVGTTPYAGVWVERAPVYATVTGASWATNVVSFVTTTLGPMITKLAVGDQFQVLNATPALYNGRFTVASITYTSTTQITITAAYTTNPGTWTSGGSITADLTVASASYATGYLTVNTTRSHELYAGMLAEFAFSSPNTYDGKYEIYDCPSSTSFRIAMSADPGTLVSTKVCTYEFWPNVSNATATASMFATNERQGKVVYMGAAGLLRFGGDGTNAWGYLPPHGMKIIFPNIICCDATKVATTGVFAQTVPSATLTSRPNLVTGGVIGVVSIDKAMFPWYLQAPQAYSFTMKHTGVCESINFSEIASSFLLNNVGTGISVIASSAQTNALNVSLCYGGGTITNCNFAKFHGGTSGYYAGIFADSVGWTIKNNTFQILMTTAVGGATARNATSGALSLTRMAYCTFSDNYHVGGTCLMTTCSDSTFTNIDYIDSKQAATTATTGMTMFGMSTNTTNITINGITFGKGMVLNVHPYAGLISALVGTNNIKLRNVGTVTNPLNAGSANAMGVVLTGAAGGGGYNLTMQRIYLTNLRTGLVTGVDNSYSGLYFEDTWGAHALTYTNISLNTVTKKLTSVNAVAGQTAVYGHHWEDMFTPTSTTLATGTAWATTAGGTATFTTAAAHNLVAGDVVTISGVVGAAYNMSGGWNGTFTISTAPTTTTFTVLMPTNPGTWTSGGNLNPLLGRIALQMNEKTTTEPSASSYTINKMDAGSGFTSVGTLALINLSDEVEWSTPYWLYGYRQFTYGATAPWTATQPTFTATNPNNHDWFYDLDKGAGYSGTWKNLHFKGANGGASWGISTTALTLTPITATVTGSISGNTLTVTAVTSGVLGVGMIVTGTGIAANTIITAVPDAPLGKLGTYTVSTITFAAGSYTISATNQTVASTTITGTNSTYGISVGDYIFDLTTAGNVPTGSTVTSVNSATSVTMSSSGTTASSQVLAFSTLHTETGITAATGFRMKVKVRVNTYATTNLLTAVSIPTVTNSTYQQTQYPLDTVTTSVVLTNVVIGSRYRVENLATGALLYEGTAADTTVTLVYVWNANLNVKVRVRKSTTAPKYLPFETIGTITSGGLEVYVSQILDTVAA